MRTILYLLLITFFFSCSEMPSANLGLASDFYPPKAILKAGIVNKFHITTFADKRDDATDINYTSYQMKSDTLYQNQYDAGFELMNNRVYIFNNGAKQLIRGKNYDFVGREYPLEILQNTSKIWEEEDQNGILHYRQQMPTYKREIAITQDHTEDTSYLDVKAKKFVSEYKTVIFREGDTTTYKGKNVVIMGLNRGKVHYRNSSEESQTIGELVEQMSLKNFKERSRHGKHRIGYIDPDRILDKGSSFKPCSENPKDIHDYYNGSPDGNLKGKKGRKWSFISQYLIPEKLAGQSGYLSIHFVINCEGKIGYFTAEQADLDYQPHQFSQEAIDHLVELTQKMQPWVPAKIWNENKDSYAYLIYKLDNGKIIEILP